MKKLTIPHTCHYCKNLTERKKKPSLCQIDNQRVYADNLIFCELWDCIYGPAASFIPPEKEEDWSDYLDVKLGILRGRRRDDKIGNAEKMRYIYQIFSKNRENTDAPGGMEPAELIEDRFPESVF